MVSHGNLVVMLHLSVLSVLLYTCAPVDGYHVLCVMPVPSSSHHYIAKGIVKALLTAGHEVTWITPYPDKAKTVGKRLNIIDVSRIQDIMNVVTINDNSGVQDLNLMRQLCSNISLEIFRDEDFRRVIVGTQFDAVVTEWFFNEVQAGIAAIQQVPWILVSSIGIHPYLEYIVDVISLSPILPPSFLANSNYAIPMNFYQRLITTFVLVFTKFDIWRNTPSIEAMYKAEFTHLAEARGVPLPDFQQALHNVSVLFLNSHSSFTTAQSLPQNVVEIAGFHIEDNHQKLAKDLQDLLDSSPQGVVYFSMGSILKSRDMPQKIKNDLVQLFGSLPYTVLWKFEEEMEGLPKNVHIRAWMPQDSILAHPNVRLFITHCGLLSSLEALHHGVPMLAVPIFGDQSLNAAQVVASGYGLKVDYSEDMMPELKIALDEMLTNDSYHKRVQYMSKAFQKRVIHPSKLVSHYIELAIETKGAHHLRSSTPLYPWYQRYLLDQLAFCTTLMYILYILLRRAFRIARKILTRLTRGKNNEKEKKN